MELQKNVQPQAEIPDAKSALWSGLFGKMDVRAYTMVGALILIWVLFGILDPTFLTARNLSNLFTQMSVTSILAIGMVLVIVAGHIDLSVGSIVGLTGGIAAIFSNWLGLPAIVVILATLAAGAVLGLVQGWLVAYKMVPAFIVTLGGMMVFRGALMGITGSMTIPVSDPVLALLGNAYFAPGFGIVLGVLAVGLLVWSMFNKRRSRQKYGFEVASLAADVIKVAALSLLVVVFVLVMNAYKGIPFPIIFVIVLAAVFYFLSKKTTFGRHIYAIGGNLEAARLSGINIRRKTMLIFLLSGLLSSIAAIVLTSRLASATITAGNMAEMDAIAACVIGGTSLMGGAGTVLGALIGALVMTSLDNGMSLMGLESFWQYVVKGSILVFAVWLDISNRRKGAN
ncbi:sugar ABC transporter permease [Paenibacillus macerans]|uniref:Xylose transport system permease protein XylH n=1 Tax=Paenibacillus macerans TaxID=44252 RepID=A0A090Z565_PAEMA|nr:sugar ABC transporter permease [Paenibacillus macerans]KFN05782.1 branched-chain amino acid transport system / permease component family protein [Paenibacillus macerans]MCY7557933.1 sugar ABC transporter permease [Paenibacillus macerans]MEC0141420.1 sugar ABC transporter permease [Paenibacillus macerans]MEC0152666.1 sugar ABC transporter permease [Paenibacillus macerans]SUA85354.1 monosaccharide-transporting ATPase [Paenibacillus macerans]